MHLLNLAYHYARFYAAKKENSRTVIFTSRTPFEPLVNLGGVLLNLNRPGEALGYDQRAAARPSNDALANSQLGLAYFELNDPERAEKYLKIAVKLDPAHFSHPQLTLAQIYMRRGDRTAAIDEWRDFLRRHPDSPEAAGVRGKIAALSR